MRVSIGNCNSNSNTSQSPSFIMLNVDLYHLSLLLFVQSLQFGCCVRFWGKLSMTSPPQLSVLPGVCSMLHCSGPAPTRHECQIASKVNFLSLTLIRSTFHYFLFMPANTVTALFLSRWFVTLSLQWHQWKSSDSPEPWQQSSCSIWNVTHRGGVGEIVPY